MNVLLRKITIISDENIQVLNTNVEKSYFGRNKLVETITTERKTYEYWIQFNIDQGRFYYGERKPVEVENREGIYVYQSTTSHTKRGLDKSLEIITEIKNRTNIIHPEWEIKLYQIQNMPMYRQFDKDRQD